MSDNLSSSTVAEEPSFPSELLNILRAYREDERSLLVERDVEDYKCTASPENNNGGQWSDESGKRELLVLLVGPLGRGNTTPYGTLENVPEKAFKLNDDRIRTARYKFAIETNLDHYPAEVSEMLGAQASNLITIERLREGDPEYDTPEYRSMPKKLYTVNSFVRGQNNVLRIAMATDRMFIENKASGEAALKILHKKKEDVDVVARGDATVINPEVMPLSKWPDPSRRFKLIHSVGDWLVNLNIKAFDEAQRYVHPLAYGVIFHPGVWVAAECKLMFWDMTHGEADRAPPYESGSSPSKWSKAASRTYQIVLKSIKVIWCPDADDAKRGATTASPAPMTPQKRPLQEGIVLEAGIEMPLTPVKMPKRMKCDDVVLKSGATLTRDEFEAIDSATKDMGVNMDADDDGLVVLHKEFSSTL